MVLTCGIDRVTQPSSEWLDHHCTRRGVLAQLLPLFIGWLSRFAQDLGRYRQLANVVEQESPAQLIELFAFEAELDCKHLAVGANALGMTSCKTFVLGQRSDHRDGLLRSLLQRSLQRGSHVLEFSR